MQASQESSGESYVGYKKFYISKHVDAESLKVTHNDYLKHGKTLPYTIQLIYKVESQYKNGCFGKVMRVTFSEIAFRKTDFIKRFKKAERLSEIEKMLNI